MRQTEEALQLLERVFARGWGTRDWVDHDPDYDILRDDPEAGRETQVSAGAVGAVRRCSKKLFQKNPFWNATR